MSRDPVEEALEILWLDLCFKMVDAATKKDYGKVDEIGEVTKTLKELYPGVIKERNASTL